MFSSQGQSKVANHLEKIVDIRIVTFKENKKYPKIVKVTNLKLQN